MRRVALIAWLAAATSSCGYTVTIMPVGTDVRPDSLVEPFVGSPAERPLYRPEDFYPRQEPWSRDTLYFPSTPSAPYTGPFKIGDTIRVTLTAYSSDPQHTDDTPHETASGTRARRGIIAHNGLPFRARVRFPEVFGLQEFVVEDRMNARYDHAYADVWWPTHDGAHAFPMRRNTLMEIVWLPE